MYKVKPVSEQNFDEILAAVWNSSIAFWRYIYIYFGLRILCIFIFVGFSDFEIYSQRTWH